MQKQAASKFALAEADSIFDRAIDLDTTYDEQLTQLTKDYSNSDIQDFESLFLFLKENADDKTTDELKREDDEARAKELSSLGFYSSLQFPQHTRLQEPQLPVGDAQQPVLSNSHNFVDEYGKLSLESSNDDYRMTLDINSKDISTMNVRFNQHNAALSAQVMVSSEVMKILQHQLRNLEQRLGKHGIRISSLRLSSIEDDEENYTLDIEGQLPSRVLS